MKFEEIERLFTGAIYSYGRQGLYFKSKIEKVEEFNEVFWGDKVILYLVDNAGAIQVPIDNIKKVNDLENCKYCYSLKNMLDEEIGHVCKQ